MPATDCDLDHTITWAQSPPGVAQQLPRNAGGVPDHRLKHNGWTYKTLPNGATEWTSPLGHTYITWRDPP
jgi:hypothetical protein